MGEGTRLLKTAALIGVTASTLSVGCEAQTTITTAVQISPPIAPSGPDPALVHLQVKQAESFKKLAHATCPPFDPTASSEDRSSLKTTPTGLVLRQTDRPSVPEFCVAGWYDANGNGKIDSGDATGVLREPYPNQPSKFFSSNRYESPALVLETLP